MLGRSTSPIVWLLILSIALSSGCDRQPDTPFRVAFHPWPAYELMHLARELGYYDEHRLRLVETTSASQTSRALRNGAVEAGALTLDEVITLLQKGVALRLAVIFDESSGADALVAHPHVTHLGALRGGRVGVERTAVGAILLDAALTASGLCCSDLDLVYLTVDEHEAAYAAGQVDAVVTFEPTQSRLVDRGARVLFSSRETPGRILDVLAVRAETIEAHAASLTSLLQGYFSALNYFREQPQRAAVLIAPRLGVDPNTVQRTFAGLRLLELSENRRLLAQGGINRSVQTLAQFMAERRLVPSVPSLSGELADGRWLPEGEGAP